MKKQRVVAAMSGGVDSAVAAGLLTRQGYELSGITMPLWTVADPNAPASHRRQRPFADARSPPRAEVLHQRRDRSGKIRQSVGQLARGAALIDVRIPAAAVGERDLQSHVGLDQLRDRAQLLSEWRPRIIRPVGRGCLLRLC